MDEGTDTSFKDKTGRSIYVGDIVQHRLGKFGKSGGSSTLTVIKFGKKYHIVADAYNDNKYGGVTLGPEICKNLVVINSNHISR